MFKTYLGWALGGLACIGVVAVLKPSSAGSEAERRALAEGRALVIYWDRHSGHEHAARAALIDEYNRTQGVADSVYVRALPIGYNQSMEKMLTSIAAGSPPDICSIDTSILAQLASQGCFYALAEWMRTEPSLEEAAFFPHTWEMVHFPGYDAARQTWVEDTWGIPTTTDTYCLLWNKDAFRRAGLDPDVPPRTIGELEAYAAKLTVRGPTGVDQIGFLPWFPWDLTFMWGELFGGRWFDETAGYAVCGEDLRIIASLAWQQRFSIDPAASVQLPFAMDPAKVQSFEKMGAYQSANNPFYSGKVAMIAEGEWQVTFIAKYAPNLDWGVAPLPQPEGAPSLAYGPTTVADSVPTSAQHRDAALKFLRWFYSPRSGGGYSPASDYNEAIHNIPPRRDEALQERFMGDPKFRVFIEELLNKPVIRYPVSPETQFFLDQVSSRREYVVRRDATPEDAAREIEVTTNAALEKTYRLMGKTAL